ncbi:MAG: hypothetical protein HY696_03950 [Deltaproteobacteria bacterium]|nr:hypothetical protein [Deltaproteobacteria bacterium]
MDSKFPELGLKELIFYLYRDTLLPEMYDLLGEEETLKLVLVFGGMKISIPSMKEINDLKRNIDVFLSLSYSQGHETLRFLADKYEVTEVWIRAVYKKMHREYPKILQHLRELSAMDPVHITTRRNPVHGNKETQKN